MNNTMAVLHKKASELLREKKVDSILGYGLGSKKERTIPLFMKEGEEGKLVWNPFCSSSLPTYLFLNTYQGLKRPGKKIGLVVKGCDAKALVRIINDHLVKREDLVIMGIPCTGTVDVDKLKKIGIKDWDEIVILPDKVVLKSPKGDREFSRDDLLYKKCLSCTTPTPQIYDVLMGEPIKELPVTDHYKGVKEIEGYSLQEKREYWKKQFDRCIRCYACRNVCPACNCKSCIFQEEEGVWTGKGVDRAENLIFHFTRAFHVAGRCMDCGECERVCPMEIPLMSLNRKIQKDIFDLFHTEPPLGEEDLHQKPPLGFFLEEDHEEFL